MCIICLEIYKGIWTDQESIQKNYQNKHLNSIDGLNEDHLDDMWAKVRTLPVYNLTRYKGTGVYIPTPNKIVVNVEMVGGGIGTSRSKLFNEKTKTCSCGAKHTSFPQKHLKFCDLN